MDFSALQVLLSHLWEKEKGVGGRRKKRKKGRREKGNRKRKKDRKEEVIYGEGAKKKKSSAGFKLVRLVLLVFLSVKGRGWLEGLVSLFSLSEPHSLLLFSLNLVPQGPSAPH